MRVCHVTAHLPPDQAANALLPFHLGRWARDRGDEVSYVAHPPRALERRDSAGPSRAAVDLPGPVVWVPPRQTRSSLPGIGSVESLLYLVRLYWRARRVIAQADLVHVHSNGLLPEGAALIAARLRKPVVLTLYGTEIWHYQPRRTGVDLFSRAFRSASRVTFYSRGLLDRAVELGLDRDGLNVIYPPVAEYFLRRGEQDRLALRRALGLQERHVLVNVKRLHPLAGQRHLIDAMPAVLRSFPDTRLVICGTGPLADDLARQALERDVASRVTFTGLVDNQTVARYQEAADVFVLPSDLEACPTVAVEALGCGTPVVSTDNPGGVELAGLFGGDVTVVPRGDPAALGDAIVAALLRGRRADAQSADVVAREFSPTVVETRFRHVYDAALQGTISPLQGAAAPPR